MIDWPAKIAQAEAKGLDIEKALAVSRTTVWRWKTKETTPSGDHAGRILELAGEENNSLPVSPLQQPFR